MGRVYYFFIIIYPFGVQLHILAKTSDDEHSYQAFSFGQWSPGFPGLFVVWKKPARSGDFLFQEKERIL